MSETPASPREDLARGDRREVRIERMAHGGEGIALIDERVVFVKGAFPGDVVLVEVGKVKKSFARAALVEVLEPSPLRGEHRCPAAAAGGGCCDFSALKAEEEAALKKGILIDQLNRLGGFDSLPEVAVHDLAPHTQWRTRVRLGVSAQGKAGVRMASSQSIVEDIECTQAPAEMYRGVMGDKALHFTPGAEVVAAIDDAGEHHVVEIKKAPRGRRAEKVSRVYAGSGTAVQELDGVRFELPATAFWQAHKQAAHSYSALIREWIERYLDAENPHHNHIVGWDLYGGVGAFVPAMLEALGAQARVHSVEASSQAARSGEAALDCEPGGVNAERVTFHSTTVEKAIEQLPQPQVVVLDPPRTGAGHNVISSVAQAKPEVVIHIGCDPATFARDAQAWTEAGYSLHQLALFNAFPGTHHMETIGLYLPSN